MENSGHSRDREPVYGTGAAEYARRARQHRPTTEEGMRAAARELAQRGLSEFDIGAALQVDPAAVRRLVAATGPEAAEAHRRAGRAP